MNFGVPGDGGISCCDLSGTVCTYVQRLIRHIRTDIAPAIPHYLSAGLLSRCWSCVGMAAGGLQYGISD